MAGIIFQTSFDHYTTLTDRWTSASSPSGFGGSGSIVSSVGRNGTSCYKSSTSGSNSGHLIRKALSSNLTTSYIAWAFKINSMPDNNATIAFLDDNATNQISVNLNLDGQIKIYRGGFGGTLLGTAARSILPNIWYHFELKTVIDNTNGIIQFKINEVSELSLSSIDTQVSANAYITSFSLGHYGTSNSHGNNKDFYFDDVVVRDDVTVGDKQVKVYLPTGTGSTNTWSVVGASTTQLAVDESTPNDDTDYAATSTAGSISLWTYDSIDTSAVINAIVPLPRLVKDAAGTATVAPAIVLGSTTYIGSDSSPSITTYEYFPTIYMTSPATGVTWTANEWNSPIEIGVKRTS